MKVLEKAKNVCLASMLTPHLTERKYFNLCRFPNLFRGDVMAEAERSAAKQNGERSAAERPGPH